MMKNILLVLLAGFLMVACSESSNSVEPTPEIDKITFASSTNLAPAFDVEGGTISISFTSSKSWTASLVNNRADSWCKVEPTSGSAGSNTISIKVAPNEEPDDKSAVVQIKSGNATETVNISQKQKNALTLTSNKYEVDAKGGSVEIEVKANVKYSYSIDEAAKEWIVYESSRALATSYLKFKISPNESLATREGTITISDGVLSETVTIYQQGEKPSIIISQKEYTIGADADTIQVEVSSNVNVEIQMPDVNWIAENQSRAYSTNTYHFIVSANETYDNRSAEIIFMNIENNLEEKVVVNQMQRNAIVLAKNEYTLEKEACHLDFDIQANVAFEVKTEGDWIKQVQSRGLESHSLYFDIAENTGDDEREGKIVISSDNIEQVIKVIQRGKTVDVEKIAEYVVEVSEKVDPLFMECETIEELATHLDKIKNMNGVADAWVTNTALFVETEGGFPLSWLYTPDVDEEGAEAAVAAISENELVKSRTVSWDEHEYMGDFNEVCIVNQQANDKSRDFLKPQYQTLVANFKNAGFKVEAIDGEEMDVKFMRESLASYDILFLITHGSYDGRGGHWILSGEEVWNKEFMTWMLLGDGLKGFGYATIKEIRDGKPEEVCYVKFSESFFNNSMSGTFDKSIIFNVSCQSLKENNSLAKAFISRGASVYVGYDESDNIGHEAGRLFYESMLLGMTVKEAGTNLPEWCRINRWTDEKGKEIVSNLKGFGSDTSIGNVCIIHPEPITMDATSVNPANAILNGKVKRWVKTLEGEIGFCYSANDNEPTIEKGCDFESLVYEPMTGNPEFQIELEGIEPNVTYYYRAYIGVNGQYIYGNVKSFTTHNPVTTLDATNIGSTFATLNANVESWMNLFIHFGFCYSKDGENLDVNNGIRYGEIVAFNFDSKLNSVVLDALEPGTTYYYRAFTEIYKYGQYVYVYGDVKSFTTTAEELTNVAEAVDLGLSVLWASHNVGATKPEEYGDYYAWGETEKKEKYTVLNYKFYNMMTGEMADLGKEISGTKYDVAKIKWGDGWRMPTTNEMLELTEQCEWTDTICSGVKGKKVTSVNGNSIFLPAAGMGAPGSDTFKPGEFGLYWLGTLNETYLGGEYLCFEFGYPEWISYGASREYGQPIRPVKDK